MMQSRLAATVAGFSRIGFRKRFLVRSFGTGATTGRTADPAVHSVEPEEVSRTDSIIDEKRRHRSPEQESTGKDAEPYVHTKSGPKLESSGVAPLINPTTQQKRRISNYSTDGSPWPKSEDETDRKVQREEQERDNREYFKHHKASPLSHIQVADTRKPITQATDRGGSENYVKIIDGSTVKLWSPEQLDTVDDSLRRAMEIYRRNAEMGDPDSPHGKVLRQLRGEYW
ncbi:uncharacterized protein LOC127258726 [Andrographis paniculata]|uniref:uncharacterized protein LOC127258726 n=1 Tax=Andrographis paniculata TaxID=175694 RepID=UPI0021E97EE7|nr:uncharacterized protein LOC127258726 [Andrographis paniculata]